MFLTDYFWFSNASGERGRLYEGLQSQIDRAREIALQCVSGDVLEAALYDLQKVIRGAFGVSGDPEDRNDDPLPSVLLGAAIANLVVACGAVGGVFYIYRRFGQVSVVFHM